MSLFLSLLPLYLLGNIHCAGMCGPLVMLLAKHPYRYLYFFGRLLAFSFAGLLSAEIGLIFFSTLQRYRLDAIASFFFGGIIIALGFCLLFRLGYPGSRWLAKRTAPLSAWLGHWVANRSPYATFLFGLCTLLLPCGQTLVVFAACAMNATPLAGLFNGFAFALLTSPSLIAAMHAGSWLHKLKKQQHLWMGVATLLIGTLALLRACAACDWIPHCTLDSAHHLVLY